MHYRRRQIAHDYSSIDDMNKESNVEERSSDSDHEYETSENLSETQIETKTEVKYPEKFCENYKKYIDDIKLSEDGVFFALFIIGGVLILLNLLFT